AEKDACVLFVDGLRFDVAGKLAALLEGRSLRVVLTHRLAPLPSVTATAKPAAAPIREGIQGNDGADFAPLIPTPSGAKPFTASLLRARLEAEGVEGLDSNELKIPAGAVGGWTECGLIDTIGHSLQ